MKHRKAGKGAKEAKGGSPSQGAHRYWS